MTFRHAFRLVPPVETKLPKKVMRTSTNSRPLERPEVKLTGEAILPKTAVVTTVHYHIGREMRVEGKNLLL